MELIHINPYVRYASLQKSKLLEPTPRLCYDCRLFFVVNGNGSIRIKDTDYAFATDTIIFLPPGTEYAIHCPQPANLYVLNFDLSVRYTHIESSLGTPFLFASDRSKILSGDAPQQFAAPFVLEHMTLPKQLVDICQLFHSKEHSYKERASALLKLCLLDLSHLKHKDPNTLLTTHILDYIYAHYAEITLTNQTIAEHFGYHPYYISDIVKQVTGKSLHQHLIEHRLSIAMDLLMATDYDIKTISWKSGFNSVSYFIKTFHAKLGMTPLEYRKRL